MFLEDEEEETEELLFLAAASTGRGTHQRLGIDSSVFVRDRLEWDKHVAALQKEGDGGSFRRMYRMDIDSFVKLSSMLKPHLCVDERMSKICTSKGKITTDIVLHCLIRWLAGGSYLDIRLSAGISRASFYRCIHSAMDGLCSTDKITIDAFPPDESQLVRLAADFKDISGTGGILNGCVGVEDGFLLPTGTPSVRGSNGNVKAYFSGHYQCYGINV